MAKKIKELSMRELAAAALAETLLDGLVEGKFKFDSFDTCRVDRGEPGTHMQITFEYTVVKEKAHGVAR